MNKKYIFIIIAILIAAVVPFIFQKYTQNAKNKADEFMKYATALNLDSAKTYCVGNIKLDDYFNNDEKIENYSQSGFGIKSLRKVDISYFVKGTPADQRNLTINFLKTRKGWEITGIALNYHILREDKLFALEFINNIICNSDEALKYLTTNRTEDFFTLQKTLCNSQAKIILLDAKPVICNKKYCPENTSEAEFFFKYSNYKFKIKTKHHNDEFSVTEFTIIQ